MTRELRSYNPGRDDRWGDRRSRMFYRYRHIRLGTAQVEANDAALRATGRPLMWKVHPEPFAHMSQLQQAQVTGFVQRYPDHNQLRLIDGTLRYVLQAPPGYLDEQEGTADLPGDPTPSTPAADAGVRMDRLERETIAASLRVRLEAAYESGGLRDQGTIDAASRIRNALIAPGDLWQALQLHLGCKGSEVLAKVVTLAALVPDLKRLVRWFGGREVA